MNKFGGICLGHRSLSGWLYYLDLTFIEVRITISKLVIRAWHLNALLVLEMILGATGDERALFLSMNWFALYVGKYPPIDMCIQFRFFSKKLRRSEPLLVSDGISTLHGSHKSECADSSWRCNHHKTCRKHQRRISHDTRGINKLRNSCSFCENRIAGSATWNVSRRRVISQTAILFVFSLQKNWATCKRSK